jgi:endoglucanase
MQKSTLSIIGLLILGLPLQAQPSVAEQLGAPTVKGNQIVDKNGNPFVVRGMSLYWSQWKGQFYNPDAIKWLRDDWRCTVVRAAMAAGTYVKNPEAEKRKIQTVVQAAIDLGIYVIIDWHTDRNTYQPQSEAFFEEMAKTYGDKPNVIFEIWNEPLNSADWKTVIKPYHEAVIPKIRAHSKNLIICGTQTWSQDVDKAAKDPLKFDNLAYTLHFYTATHHQSLRNKAQTALKGGVALFVTEWGASEASGNGRLDEAETRTWLDFMDKNQLSWATWSVADLRETSAALRPGADPKGGWPADMISPAGTLVRNELRARNPPPAATPAKP